MHQEDEEGVGLVQKTRGFQQQQEAAIHVIRVPAEMKHDDGYNCIEDGRGTQSGSGDTRTRWRGTGTMSAISRAATTRMAQVARAYEDLKM